MAANTATIKEKPTLTIDRDGHRTYSVKWQVRCTDILDGPGIAASAAGLPTPGASYSSLGLNDSDAWAFFNRQGAVNLVSHSTTDGGPLYEVVTEFTTRPAKRCQTSAVEDPLLEPPRLSGGFNKFTKEATADVFGSPVRSSSFERFRGKMVEIDDSRMTFKLGLNWASLNLNFLGQYRDAVNSDTWWGLSPRMIKCNDWTWERVLYGTCNFYFKVEFVFEVNTDRWDRAIPDEGTMILKAGGNANNPADFVIAKDIREENMGTVFLNGFGEQTANPFIWNWRLYQERPFAAVGWPAGII